MDWGQVSVELKCFICSGQFYVVYILICFFRWLIGAGLAFELIGFTWMLGLMADATPGMCYIYFMLLNVFTVCVA